MKLIKEKAVNHNWLYVLETRFEWRTHTAHRKWGQFYATIGHIQMLLLLYADDVVVFAKSSSELQQEMDKLFNYCNKWKLKLNTTKSKIVVFRKGNVAPRQSWKFGNDDIEAVNSLSYLGVLFSSNGLFTQAQCKLADQANKAVFTLYKRIH